jgi:hypothetical protein
MSAVTLERCACKFGVVTACVLICTGLAGCGKNLAQVSGTVTVDGQPLRSVDGVKATVYFQPENGGPSGVGPIDAEGQYTLSTGSQDGVPPGEYLVTCSATRIISSSTPGGTPTGKRITDPKYASAKTSGLRFSVKEGDNQFDIALESPKASTRRP